LAFPAPLCLVSCASSHAFHVFCAEACVSPAPSVSAVFFFKQKTAYEIGLGIPAEPLFRSAANQVVSVGADIAFDADPKFFACLVRFESSSVPTTLPTAYDVYPLDGRHDGGYYTVKDCVTIDVLPRTP